MSEFLGSWSGMRKYLEQEMLAESLKGRVRYGCTTYVGMDGAHVFEVCIDDLLNLFNRKVNKVFASGLLLNNKGKFELKSGSFDICDFTPHETEYYLKILNTAKRYLDGSK